MADTPVQTLSIQIDANADRAVTSLKNLSLALQNLKSASKGISLNNVVKQLSNLANVLNGFDSTKLSAISSGLSSLNGLRVNIPRTLSSRLTELATSMQNISDADIDRLNRLCAALSQLQGVSLTGLGGAVRAAGQGTGQGAGGTPTPNPGGTGDTGATDQQNQIQQATGETNATIQTQESLVKRLGDAYKGSAGPISTFISSLKRIAFYRFLRSIIKGITDAMKTGINDMYEYSSVMGTEFKSTMDSFATSALYAKNAFGAMAAPLLNAFMPVITTILDGIADLFNTLGAVFAYFTGNDTFSAAKKYVTEYDNGINQANKDTKQFFLGFDEINAMSKNSSSSGSTLDYSQMFEEADVTDYIGEEGKSLIDNLKSIQKDVDDLNAKQAKTEAETAKTIGDSWLSLGATIKQVQQGVNEGNVKMAQNESETAANIGFTLGGLKEKFATVPSKLSWVKQKFIEYNKGIALDFKDKWNGLKTSAGEALDNLKQKIKTKWESIKSWFKGLSFPKFEIKLPKFTWTYSEMSDGVLKTLLSAAGWPTSIPHLNVEWVSAGNSTAANKDWAGGYAKGGIVSGDIFMANENGSSEYIGSIGGKTGVANQMQMTDAIGNAVYKAMDNAMRNNKSSNKVAVYLDGKQITTSQRQKSMQYGR